MKTVILIFLFAVNISLGLLSQPEFNWISQFDNSFGDYGVSLATDKNNHSYFTGYSGGFDHLFIVKKDSTNLLWEYSPEQINFISVKPSQIETDTLGNIYLLLELNGSLVFGNDTISSSPSALHLVKLQDTVVMWNIEIPISNSSDHLLETTVNGDCYVTNSYSDTEVIGSDTINAIGETDIFITKISSNGQFLWTRSYGTSFSNRGDVPRGISTDSSENIYILYSQSYLSSDWDGDSYIVILDSTGQLLNQAQITDYYSYKIEFESFTTSESGHSYIVMHFGQQSSLIKDTLISLNYEGHVLVVYDESLTFLKKRIILDTTNSGNFQPTVIQTNNSEVAIGGRTFGTFDVAIDSINSGLFVLKYDSLLNLNWSKNFPSNFIGLVSTRLADIALDEKCIRFLCSTRGSNILFDNINFSCDYNDVFFGCIDNDTTICYSSTATIPIVACDSFTSPSGNYTWTDSGTYIDTISNVSGCDSIITLNLDIINVDISISNNSPSLTSNSSGSTYKWLDCDNAYAFIPGETNQTFAAPTNGNYAVEVTKNGCTDTSSCVEVNNVSLFEYSTFKEEIVMFPNPTNGTLVINLGDTYNDISVIIRNTNGQKVLSKNYSASNILDLIFEGEPGIYIVEISSNRNKAVGRVIKI